MQESGAADVSASTAPETTAAPEMMGLGFRIVRAIGWTFIWLGLLTLGFVAHQLWVTSWLAERNQVALSAERQAYNESAVVTEEVFVPPGGISDGATGGPVTIQVEATPADGEAFALIRIPSIPELVDGWNVVQGVSVTDLRNGAGHMPATPLPGQPGNAVISGHRTTYGAPFHNLDTLEEGDTIEVDTAIGTHVYEVRDVENIGVPLDDGAGFVVTPTDVFVTDPLDGGWLTLTTCHPKFSARERLIIRAELIAGPNADAIRGAL